MKIIQVIPHLGSGGAERLVVDLCNQLVCAGHTVTLCTLFPLVSPWAFYLPQLRGDVKVVSFNKNTGFSIRAFWALTCFLLKEKPDVIHTHLRALPYTAFAELIYKGVHTIHNEASVEAADKINRFFRFFLFRLKRVQPVAISPESFHSFQNYYGFEPVLVINGRNIPQDLDVSPTVQNEFKLYRKNNSRVIVHLAHLDDNKRQVLHARIAYRLYNEGYKFSVLFIGSTADEAYTQEVRDNCPPCAYILGEKHNPLEYLKEAGAFALTSRFEGMPMSLIEALGVGAIPVCMPLGGIPDFVHDGENGILSDDLDEESFYRAEKRFLDLSDEEISVMKDKALASYYPLTMDLCAERYVSVYRTLSPNMTTK